MTVVTAQALPVFSKVAGENKLNQSRCYFLSEVRLMLKIYQLKWEHRGRKRADISM